ncbi:MAG: TolC family protein [Fimbriimonadaceae bacterium]|nr:TolC family protein [Chthonomonadaceae bacterium]MCO5296030.1 TolC family protein [Fimbriimonadaceae bacterium]
MVIATLFQGAPTLTLSEAIDLGVQNAFSVRLAETAVEKTRNQLSAAKGSLGPSVAVNGTYTRFDKATVAQFGSQSVVVSPIDSKQASLSLNWQVDIAGNTGRAIKAAKNLTDASEAQRDAQVNDVKERVRQAYYGVLQSIELLDVVRQTRDANKARLANAQVQFEAGTVARVDVLRFDTQLAQSESDVLAAENQVRLAKQALNNVLGRPIETPFDPEPVTVLPKADAAADSYVAEALASRPEIVAQRNTLDALRFVREAEQRGLSPSLNLSAVHNRNIDAQGFSSRSSSTTGTAVISWPIFDSGITRSRVHAAQRDEESASLQLEQLKLGISLEVRQALSNLRDAEARQVVAAKQATLAEESYRLAQVRYDAGEGIQLEVTDALTELTRARAGVVNARYDTLNAYAALQRAVASDAPQGGAKEQGESIGS